MGFANAELLQDTDWEQAQTDFKKAQPRAPRWIWAHDPEPYVYEHWTANLAAMKNGVPFEESDVPPNFPPGYKFEPWSIVTIMENMRKGIPVDLGAGDWT